MHWKFNARTAKAVLIVVLMISPCIATFAQSGIGLSQQEQDWLDAHPRIRVFQDPGWPPVEFVDETGKNQGITVDYLSLIEERLGISFERIRGLEWAEAYALMKSHDIDMTTSVAITPERLEFWNFTKPYMMIPIVYITQSDVTYISGMHELSGKRVAIVEGYAVGDWIPQDYPSVELVPVSSAIEGLELLGRGEVFAFIENMLVASYYMAKLRLTNIKIAGNTPYVNAQSMAVRNDWDTLVNILQKALDSISENERSAIYYKWVPIRYEYGFDFALFWRTLAILSAIIIMLSLWILRLRIEISKRKKAEAALSESDGRLRLHLAQTPVAVIEWSADFRVLDWNPAAERIFGYTRDEALGKHAFFIVPNEVRPEIDSILTSLIAGPVNVRSQNQNVTKDGETIICDWINTSLSTTDGTVSWVVSLILDVTREKLDEEKIRISLAEKEMLLRELYHRTNNNMNVISSLLQLQAMMSKNPSLSDIVDNTVLRIQSMALAHQDLYQSKNLSRIDLGTYLRELVEKLQVQLSEPGRTVNVRCDVDEIEVLIDVAVPCGLLVNELAMNSFMHAFKGRSAGTITIQMRRKGMSTIEILYSDDGRGIDSGLDLRKAETLGLMTVFNIAAKQLGATVHYDSSRGLAWEILFDNTIYAERALMPGQEQK